MWYAGVKRVPVYNCGRNEKRNDPPLPRIKDEFVLKPKQAMFSPINETREGGGVILIFHCNSSWGVFQHTIKTKLQYERNRLQIFIFFPSPCHARVGLNESEGRKSWKR